MLAEKLVEVLVRIDFIQFHISLDVFCLGKHYRIYSLASLAILIKHLVWIQRNKFVLQRMDVGLYGFSKVSPLSGIARQAFELPSWKPKHCRLEIQKLISVLPVLAIPLCGDQNFTLPYE